MRYFVIILAMLTFCGTGEGKVTDPNYPGFELVWSDEFNGDSLDGASWNIAVGRGGNGWGNQEWQYYTGRKENLRVEGGNLVIEAREEKYEGSDYTSARIDTAGKHEFKYGRIEARIKSPAGGHGVWPAFWMLGDNIGSVGWPSCGEIDIFEMMTDGKKALGTLHFGSSKENKHEQNGSELVLAEELGEKYHIYAVEWDEKAISWYVDDKKYYSTSKWWSDMGDFPAPFDHEYYILLNFAVGSGWWDKETTKAEVTFPRQMLVDYVRVYKAVGK